MSAPVKYEAFQRVGVGLLFLLVSVGVLYLLLFIEMPATNEKPIMLVIGGIMTAGSMALMKLVQGGEAGELAKRDAQIAKLQAKMTALEQRANDKDAIISDLLDRLGMAGSATPQARIEDNR